MNPAEIAAYIGAAAWLPQIITWAYKALSKPSLKLISSPTIELGYTSYGPIVNLTCSISASRQDALIDKIDLVLVHEKGDTRTLTWSFLDEKQQEIRSYKGETAQVTKNQPAIALKVPTIALAEKKIGFQDLEFQSQFTLHLNKLGELQNYQKKRTGKGHTKLFESKEFSDLVDFFNSHMYWNEGTYTLSVRIREVTRKNPHLEQFRFTLSKNHIERMQQNCLKLESDIKAYLGVRISKSSLPQWNWVYPQVVTIS